MADDSIDFERLERIVRGEGTTDERADHERWLKADPVRARLVEAMRNLDGASPELLRRWDAHAALVRFKTEHGFRTDVPRSPRLSFGGEARRSRYLRYGVYVAGVAATLVLAVVADIRSRRATPARPSQAAREVVTASGQRAVLDLNDGTHVVLSAESHLRIPQGFGAPGQRRVVSLEGEALFVVQHDTTRPFLLQTPHATFEDLGTEFVVNTYPEMKGTRLAVREGRVTVRQSSSTPRDSVATDGRTLGTLGPGDVAHLGERGGFSVERGQNLSMLFAATEGALVLRNEVMRDAIPRLERWFGVRIAVAHESLLSRRISAVFRNDTATEAFDVIAIALESKARWRRNEVTLVPDQGDGGNP